MHTPTTRQWIIVILLLAAAGFITRCSQTGPLSPAPAQPKFLAATPDNLKSIPLEKLYKTFIDMERQELIDLPEFIRRVKGVQVLFFGESHTNDAQHALQLNILSALNENKNARLVLAMEFLYRPIQPQLNEYSAGRMTEEEITPHILKGLSKDWYDKYYRPLITYAGQNHLGLLGLNADKVTKAKYAKVGWDGLTDEEKQYVAQDIDLTNQAHKDYVRKASEEMIKMGVFSEQEFDRMYWGQCVWDETMGETIANYLKARAKEANSMPVQLLVIAGSAHVEYKFNTPNRAYKRYPMSFKTLVPSETDAPGKLDYAQLLSSGSADFITFSPESPAPDISKMPKKMFKKPGE